MPAQFHRNGFRYAFVHAARTLSLAGIVSNAELAGRFNVSPTTIADWKQRFPEFAQAIEAGATELAEEMVDIVVRSARDGDIASAKYLLDRRLKQFQPSAKVEHAGRVEGLGDMLARRVTNEELVAQGILTDDEE